MRSMKPTAVINSAQVSAGGKQKPAGGGKIDVPAKANMAAAFANNAGSGVTAQLSTLKGAVASLASDHPIAHYDHGPHHGTTTHQRHSPVDMSAVGARVKR